MLLHTYKSPKRRSKISIARRESPPNLSARLLSIFVFKFELVKLGHLHKIERESSPELAIAWPAIKRDKLDYKPWKLEETCPEHVDYWVRELVVHGVG